MKKNHIVLIGLATLLPTLCLAGSWPTHRADTSRSGVTEEQLKFPLKESWVFESKYPPQPAWSGPARRDGWHKTENLKPRVIFDWAYHVVADEDSVYFGSSSDDKVYCLDSKTGEERWAYYTDGPVRLAPTLNNGKVYVGSDDGNAYCLSAKDGSLIWKYQAAPENYRLSGNGRVVSKWPVRTGVLIRDGIAYFGAGLFKWEGVYLCALDAETGKEIWKNKVENLTPQGYLLASPERLYFPNSRGAPLVFNRTDGSFLHQVGGSGGTFCLLTGDMLVYGPGKVGTLDAFPEGSNDQLATFQGNQMIVTPDVSYLHTDKDIRALDRANFTRLKTTVTKLGNKINSLEKELRKTEDKESEAAKNMQADIDESREKMVEAETELKGTLLWERPLSDPYSLILGGDTLYAGGTNEVVAISGKTGETLWTAPVKGRALDLAIAGGDLIVSTDRGMIHCFKGE
ncbi:MAG: PQQ-binding-like beta-propeller repeat protein [Candidatus Omnitrophica bacterium]|nr:PQQ-binding-like beta-propeller repeat protein [Candidatus Omnitrophota bacterium]